MPRRLAGVVESLGEPRVRGATLVVGERRQGRLRDQPVPHDPPVVGVDDEPHLDELLRAVLDQLGVGGPGEQDQVSHRAAPGG